MSDPIKDPVPTAPTPAPAPAPAPEQKPKEPDKPPAPAKDPKPAPTPEKDPAPAKEPATDDALLATAKEKILSITAEAAAVQLAVPAERIPYVLKLADLSGIAVGDDLALDREAVKAAVQKVLADIPELAKAPAPRTDPPGNPAGKPDDGKTAADEIADQLFCRK